MNRYCYIPFIRQFQPIEKRRCKQDKSLHGRFRKTCKCLPRLDPSPVLLAYDRQNIRTYRHFIEENKAKLSIQSIQDQVEYVCTGYRLNYKSGKINTWNGRDTLISLDEIILPTRTEEDLDIPVIIGIKESASKDPISPFFGIEDTLDDEAALSEKFEDGEESDSEQETEPRGVEDKKDNLMAEIFDDEEDDEVTSLTFLSPDSEFGKKVYGQVVAEEAAKGREVKILGIQVSGGDGKQKGEYLQLDRTLKRARN